MATPTTVPWGWFYAGFNEANTKIYHPPYGGAKIYHPQFLGVPNHRLIILGVVNNINALFVNISQSEILENLGDVFIGIERTKEALQLCRV